MNYDSLLLSYKRKSMCLASKKAFFQFQSLCSILWTLALSKKPTKTYQSNDSSSKTRRRWAMVRRKAESGRQNREGRSLSKAELGFKRLHLLPSCLVKPVLSLITTDYKLNTSCAKPLSWPVVFVIILYGLAVSGANAWHQVSLIMVWCLNVG